MQVTALDALAVRIMTVEFSTYYCNDGFWNRLYYYNCYNCNNTVLVLSIIINAGDGQGCPGSVHPAAPHLTQYNKPQVIQPRIKRR